MHILHLLHISDLHITNNPLVMAFKERNFNALGEAVDEYRDHIDGFLVTGDVADNTISKNDLFTAKRLLFSSNFGTKQKNMGVSLYPLNFGKKPVILLPGNHDRYQFPGLMPNAKLFDRVFSEQWECLEEGVAFHLFPHKDSPLLKIVCVDFSLTQWHHSPDSLLYMGQGHTYPERLKSLIKITDRHNNIPTIWTMHFAPDFDTKNIPKHLMLSRSQDLIDAANNKNIEHIFCGHYHKLIKYTLERKEAVKVYCSGSPLSPESGCRASIQVIRIVIENNIIKKLDTVPLIFNGNIFSRNWA